MEQENKKGTTRSAKKSEYNIWRCRRISSTRWYIWRSSRTSTLIKIPHSIDITETTYATLVCDDNDVLSMYVKMWKDDYYAWIIS